MTVPTVQQSRLLAYLLAYAERYGRAPSRLVEYVEDDDA